MSWSSGIPSVTSERPPSAAEPGRGGVDARPSAWVPATGRPGGLVQFERGDLLVYLFASTGYLVLFLLLLSISAFDQLGAGGRAETELLTLRNAVLGLGWLGMGAAGLSLWVIPTISGISVRPRGLIRAHLVSSNTLLLLYVVTDLALGEKSALSNLFLLLAALSFLLLAMPLLLAIALAIGDWRAGL